MARFIDGNLLIDRRRSRESTFVEKVGYSKVWPHYHATEGVTNFDQMFDEQVSEGVPITRA